MVALLATRRPIRTPSAGIRRFVAGSAHSPDMRNTYLTTIEPGSRGEFEVRTGGATFILSYYRRGSTMRRIPGPDSPVSPYDWRPVTFFGTIETITVGQPAVFVLSARDTWATSPIASIRFVRAPCTQCGGKDRPHLGRCWRCRIDPGHPRTQYQGFTASGEAQWGERIVRQVDRWLFAADQRMAEVRRQRGTS